MADDQPASMADNYLGSEVNPRTGGLGIHITPPRLPGVLAMDVDLGVHYTQSDDRSDRSLLGLPYGWCYRMSFVADGQVSINGLQTYQVDAEHPSGLRYYNLKNLFFRSFGQFSPPPFPFDPSRSYESTLRSLSGRIQYFDAYGRLMGMADRNGNHILYFYDVPDADVYGSRLSSVVDTYGQTITLEYRDGNVDIAFPGGGRNQVRFSYLSSSDTVQLTQYVDPLGDATTIEYAGGVVRDDLISRITYPNQLQATYQYSAIPFLDSSGAQLQRDIVKSVTHTYQSSSRTKTYSFAPDGDERNYLGFPAHRTSPAGDALFESDDNEYRYSSRVDDGVTVTTREYNHLHLELTKTITSSADGHTISRSTYTYPGEGGDEFFPPFRDLPPNFEMPTEVVTEFFNAAGQSSTERQQKDYNDYGQVTAERQYHASAASDPGALLSATESAYDPRFGLLVLKDALDYEPAGQRTDTPAVTRNLYELTPDGSKTLLHEVGRVTDVGGEPAYVAEKSKAYAYDSRGRVVSKVIAWAGGSEPRPGPASSEVRYIIADDPDAHRRSVAKVDQLGHATTSFYDLTTGFLNRTENALGASIRYTHDNLGRPLSREDAMGDLTSWTYDVAANRVTKTLSNGYQAHTYYSGFGEIVRKSDNGGTGGHERVLETTTYDMAGRRSTASGILGPNGMLTYAYNSDGLLSSKTDALGNVSSFDYDRVARRKVTYFNGIKTKDERYDSHRKIVAAEEFSSDEPDVGISRTRSYDMDLLRTFSQVGARDGEQHWAWQTRTYDVSKKLAARVQTGWDGAKQTATYDRDLFNEIMQARRTLAQPGSPDRQAASSVVTRNAVGLVVEEVTALGATKTYEYDQVGNNTSRVDFDGSQVRFEYYPNRKLRAKYYTDADGAEQVLTYEYYGGTNLPRSITSSSGERIGYEYGIDGTLRSVTYPDGKTVRWKYDLDLGRVDDVVDASGHTTSYHYDAYGRLDQITDGSVGITLSYYDQAENASASGQLKSVTYSDGTSITYSYDGYNSVQQMVVQDTHGSCLLARSYEYDPTTQYLIAVRSRSSVMPGLDANHEIRIAYNSIGKVTAYSVHGQGETLISSTVFDLDAADNVISATVTTSSGTSRTVYTYDADNKLLSISRDGHVHALMYDGNGNMVDDGSGNLYKFDGLNRLAGHNDGNGTETAYAYYPNGLRASKRIGGDPATTFYYDNEKTPNVVTEIQDGTAAGYALWKSQRLVRTVRDARSETATFLVQDRKDVALALQAAGAGAQVYNYTAYGAPLGLTSSPPLADYSITSNPLRYGSMYRDAESGLYYLHARYYDPGIMRFVTRDNVPLLNRYQYANGNPVMMSDASGHTAWWMWLIDALTFVVTTALTIVTFGAAAPAAAATDAAELGGLAAESAETAEAAAGAAGSGVAEASATGAQAVGTASDEIGAEEAGTEMAGWDDDGPRPPVWSRTNPRGLWDNCVLCTAGYVMDETAPDIAAALGVNEGVVRQADWLNTFTELGLTDEAQFNVESADAAEAFDFMSRQPAGSRFAFAYRTGDSMFHFVNAESEGPGNAVNLYDAQSGRALFGDPGALRSNYFVLRLRDPWGLMPMDMSE